MVLSRNLNLLIIVKLLVKIAYGRESSVRKICDLKWRSQLKDCSKEVILKKIKLIFSLCALPTLRVIANNVLLNECNENDVILIFGDILRRRGQAGLACFNLFMNKYNTIKCKFYFLFLNTEY